MTTDATTAATTPITTPTTSVIGPLSDIVTGSGNMAWDQHGNASSPPIAEVVLGPGNMIGPGATLADLSHLTTVRMLEAAGFEQFMAPRPDQLRFCRKGSSVKAVINTKLPQDVMFFDSVDITNPCNRRLLNTERHRQHFEHLIGLWNGTIVEEPLDAEVVEEGCDLFDDDATQVLDEGATTLEDLEDAPYRLELNEDQLQVLTDELWYTGMSIYEGMLEAGLNPKNYDLLDVSCQIHEFGLEECAICGWWFVGDDELDDQFRCCDTCITDCHRTSNCMRVNL